MNNSPQQSRRSMWIIMGLTDMVLGGAVLLVYFGYLPVDVSGLGFPRWMVGVFGAVWFFSGLAVAAYQATKTVDGE